MNLKCPKHARNLGAAMMSLSLGIAGYTETAAAQGLKRSNAAPEEIAAMVAGDQLVLSTHDGSIRFAGQSVELAGFTGILGYASDVAYIVILNGTTAVAGLNANAGRMIILPPFGEKPNVARFDAKRLGESWTDSEKSAFSDAFSALQPIATQQARQIFLGSLGRTNFNVAASGLASQELARRSIVGGNLAQEVRFSKITGDEDVSNKVVTRFLRGLVDGDVASVAQLMDPLPFGLTDMRGDPGEARLIAAQRLIYAHNWASILKDAAPQSNPETGVWTIAGTSPVEITLRNSVDLPFIKSIRIGG